jgi:hypothetical protein
MAKKSSIIPLAGYISSTYKPDISVKEINQIPPYPDVGVAYAGFAKKLTGDSGYRLLNQQSFKQILNFSWTASSSALTATSLALEGFDIYIKELQFSCYSDIDCILVLEENTGGKDICDIALKGGSSTITGNITLHSPFKLKDSVFRAGPSTPITGKITFNISGWYEKID